MKASVYHAGTGVGHETRLYILYSLRWGIEKYMKLRKALKIYASYNIALIFHSTLETLQSQLSRILSTKLTNYMIR